MEKGKIQLTQKDAENTPAGGVVVGKRDGQTMIYDDASLGGYFVGKLHSEGGIKMINKSTGQPLEVQGSEVIITAPAVSDQTKRNFEGKMMTNREILSKINSDGGGVSFADGGDIPAKIHTTDKEYEYGGKMVHDSDIAHSLGMNSTLKKGKQHFSSGGKTYDVDAIYNAVKKNKLRLKTKEVPTFAMKYPVYDKQYSETVKTDFRKPNGITVRTESGEEVLIDGNHRMNNAYLKGKKTMKTYYIEDPKQIAKFTKNSKFELGGENKDFKYSKPFGEITIFTNVEQEYVGDNYSPFENKGSFKATIRKGDLENIALESKDLANFNFEWGVDNWTTISKKLKQKNINELELYSVGKQIKTFQLRPLVNEEQQKGNYEFKNGGHLAKGKSLKQIAEMHNVSLAHVNEELARGLEVEKEHFVDFKERTRVAKDHLVENPNYYSILAKAGLEKGGKIEKEDLVKDAKSGNTSARDLNNYNDLLDVQADREVGGDSGIFADGGLINKNNLKNLEKDFLNYTDNSNYKGIYDEDEIDNGITLEWGKYGYGVSESQQDDDYKMLLDASSKFNAKNIGKLYSIAKYSDKYNTVTIVDYDILAKDNGLVFNLPEKYFAKLKVGRGSNKNVIERLEAGLKKSKDLEVAEAISKKLDVSQKKAKEIVDSLQYDKEYYEKNKNQKKSRFDVFGLRSFPRKDFSNLEETLDYIQTDEFATTIYNSANPISEGTVNLFNWRVLDIKYNEDSRPYKSDGSTDWNSRGRTLDMYPYIATNINDKQDL